MSPADVMALTPEEVRAKIAERFGYERLTITGRLREVTGWTWDDDVIRTKYYIFSDGNGGHYCRIPDYCADLNAMQEVEKAMTDEEHKAFRWHLRVIVANAESTNTLSDVCRRAYLSASADQRSRAFLMVEPVRRRPADIQAARGPFPVA